MSPLQKAIRRFGLSAVSSAVYTYINALEPALDATWGTGNTSTWPQRAQFTLTTHKIYLIGVSSPPANNGQFIYLANYAALRALSAWEKGSYVLFPEGTTITGSDFLAEFSVNVHDPIGGNSKQDPTIFGTYNPSAPQNTALYTTNGRCTIDFAGVGADQNLFSNARVGAFRFLVFRNFRFKGYINTPTLAMFLGLGSDNDSLLIENCDFDHVLLNIVGSSTVTTGPFSSVATNLTFNNVTVRHCSFRYANPSQGGNTGNFGAAVWRNLRAEHCLNYNNGWDEVMTRATPATGDAGAAAAPAGLGPNNRKHGWYWDDGGEGAFIINCVSGLNSSGGKLTGNKYLIHNWVSVYDPYPYIASAIGNPIASNFHPNGFEFRDRNLLQIGTDWVQHGGPTTFGALGASWVLMANSATGTASFIDGMLIVGDGEFEAFGELFRFNSNGYTMPTTIAVTNSKFVNAGPQGTGQADAYTTTTFGNCVTEEVIPGSGNATWSSLSPQMQALRTTLLQRKFINGFSAVHGITVTGSTQLQKARSIFDQMATRWLEKDWNYALHAYYRSALAT